MADLMGHELNGSPNAAERRAALGKILGLGHTNAKQFLQRLNRYGITRQAFEEAIYNIEGAQL